MSLIARISHLARGRLLGGLSLTAAVLVLLPLRSDGGPACDNATTSLASTQNNPVAGDEQFFTLPVGPSNVMFLLDTSGSMDNVPQCGDASSWGDGSALATCKWPTFANVSAPAIPASAGINVNANGSCNMTGNANLAWMHDYEPTAALVDPGLGVASNGLTDQPSWGTGCTGDSCLFQADKVYGYKNWTETSATPSASCVLTTYNDYDCTNPNSPVAKTVEVKLPGCEACLKDAGAPGFFFYSSYRYAYRINVVSGGKCTGTTTGSGTGGARTVLFSGGWLNANPPKFMSARKVIKQSAWIDPDKAASTDQLRFGLSFVSSDYGNRAHIVVPLGPAKGDAYPVNPSKMVEARQVVMNALNHVWPSGVTLPSLRSGGTPLASGLFRMGQYFSAPKVYTNAFGATYEQSAFAQTSAGLMKASWVDTSTAAICWSCQKNAVIIVTDGSPNSEIGFPVAIKSEADAAYDLAVNCGGANLACTGNPNNRCCSPTDTSARSRLPRVASWLHNHDLRPTEFTGEQTLVTSAVSFNLEAGNAQSILQATANMGGGSFNNAADGKELAAKVAQAVAGVSSQPTTFGAPAASALTTIHASNTKAFVTRFKPNERATWEGHLFQWMLFDEGAAGCNPAKKPDANDPTQKVVCRGKTVSANFDGNTTADGYNVCTGTFLVDRDCDEVEEEPATGLWFKKGSGKVPAAGFWDAGESLSYPTYPSTSPKAGQTVTSYTSAAEPNTSGNIAPASQYAPGKTPRTLWTALPDGTMKELETRNAAALAPFMNLDQAWCTTFEKQARLCGAGNDAKGSPLPACPATRTGVDWKTYCAEQVILFARGWDVLDQDGDSCAGPGNPSNKTGTDTNLLAAGKRDCALSVSASGEERDRPNDANTTAPSFFKLADVFHSSPVLVHPPTSEGACQFGIDNQCVRTLYGRTSNESYATGYQTPLDDYPSCKGDGTRVDAYRSWRSDLDDRRSVVLVGSNAGFLHAFDAGEPGASVSGDPVVEDGDCVPQDTTDGTGQELWAFLPPDLLPRLRDTLLNHQYMVDGNVMVRDVWLDGVANPTGGSLSRDGEKQRGEFHTVAVFAERTGGTQFTALDVTDVEAPKMMWTFPPPLSADAQWMGQSWSDFAPRPPPIGPVRLETIAGDPDPLGRGWNERWAVMINGGYDPTLTRGRAVWMVDVADGSVLWRFTGNDVRDAAKLHRSGGVGMFPVPAAVGMLDIGDPARTPFDSDNFFDTATWGDMGGNLWVARFDTPGRRNASGLVTNWKASRTFEQSRRTDDAQRAPGRSEFFYMTSNVYEPQRRAVRTMLGSGNRERILETGKGCAPDDLFSCCQNGCTVSTSTGLDYGVCGSTAAFSCDGSGTMTSPGLSSTCGAGAAYCAATGIFRSTAAYTLDCGGAGDTSAAGSTVCDDNGLCTVSTLGTGHDLVPSSTTCARSRFYGVWSYGGAGATQKTFSTIPDVDWTDARTFDDNRFTDAVDYAGCNFTTGKSCSLVDVTQAQVKKDGTVTCASGDRCQASVDDPGWYFEYNTGPCPTVETCDTGCTSEKTASSATVTRSCATWNSFLPKGSASTGTDPCAGAKTASQVAVGYASNFVSGVPDTTCNLASDGTNLFRGEQRSTIAPPSAPMIRYGISPLGQVHYSALQFDPGRAPSSTDLGTRDIVEQLYWLETSRDAHDCRHGSAANCQ